MKRANINSDINILKYKTMKSKPVIEKKQWNTQKRLADKVTEKENLSLNIEDNSQEENKSKVKITIYLPEFF